MRSGQSRMIYKRLHRALVRLKTKGRFLPQSAMGKAIDYALGQWPGLACWLEDSRVELDNNIIENAIRPTAIGKKNWMFFWKRTSWRTQRDPLHHHRSLSAREDRPLRLPAGRLHAPAIHDQPPDRQHHPSQLGQSLLRCCPASRGVKVINVRMLSLLTSMMSLTSHLTSTGTPPDAYDSASESMINPSNALYVTAF